MLHSILAIADLLAHNNLWLCYYLQVNSVRLNGMYLRNDFGGTNYFAVGGT